MTFKTKNFKNFDLYDLGIMSYQEAYLIQKDWHEKVVCGEKAVLLFVEHRPVITMGRKSAEHNIFVSKDFLKQNSIDVVKIERGGDVTYHGEGQLVIYPIFPVGRRVRDFLRKLEDVIVKTLHRFSLSDARPNPGYAGVYVNSRPENGFLVEQKIASIGVAVKKHVALHGMALNVSTNLKHFEYILPCGLASTKMTSIEREYILREIDEIPTMQAVKNVIAQVFENEFQDYDFTIPSLGDL